jgi:hypothetical protein
MFTKVCKSCGNEFETRYAQQRKCNKDCGKLSKNSARTLKRLTNDLTFIGVDGEGVDRPDGKHEYVMLSVGDKTLWRDGRQLQFIEMMQFLYEQYTDNPNAAFVGFFLGYDFIQWEKLLPERVAYLLLTNAGIAERKTQRKTNPNPYPDAVVYEGWEFDIMAGRRFRLRPHTHHVSEYNGMCRNRTCRKVMGDAKPNTFDDGPADIVPGEMEWRVPETNTTEEYNGSASLFWKFFSRKHSVGKNSKVKVNGWMYICDTGPFWQTAFVNVIKPSAWPGVPVCTEEEYETVVRGKADRGNIHDISDTSYYIDMQRYNVLENEILARVTSRLNQGFMNDVIPIKIAKEDWYGPGRAAQLWMDMLHAKCAEPSAIDSNRSARAKGDYATERLNEGGILNADVYMSLPSWYYDAAQSSYYGGWFEQFMHGHVGNVWEYDINSAYPFIIASLPCLHTTGTHNGQYSQGDRNDPYPTNRKSYTLLYGTVIGTNPYIGAMPYRSRQGLILRPNQTKGWYWLHEIQAAQRAGLTDTVSVERWVSYQPCECSPPFNPSDIGIERMYQMRLDVGKNSPQGKAAKLVYNSAYGKTAQSIGTPKYSNPVYASLITAGCRTLILEAIATHPDGAGAVSMVATDGIYFTSPHPSLDMDGSRLGAWDETFKPGMTQLMPGVYWDDKTRESISKGGSPSLKSRGINAKDLAQQIAELDAAFAQSHIDLANGGEYIWPEMELTVKFQMDSAKLALQRGKWDTAGKVSHGAIRKVSADPISKRVNRAYRCTETGITRTPVYERGIDLHTTPYSKAFGFVDGNDLIIDRDGTDGLDYFRDLIKGTV